MQNLLSASSSQQVKGSTFTNRISGASKNIDNGYGVQEGFSGENVPKTIDDYPF
jgi:hypothetical protein